ncbi:MAG TPA: hypothetical protein VJB02_06310 [Coxiellaceae bacterium]|nr:hypothetical protein [Coxiellaceae bacterium]
MKSHLPVFKIPLKSLFFGDYLFEKIQSNYLIGFIEKGVFAGTFTNSYKHRSVVAGISRYWLEKPLSTHSTLQLGYRLGLIYGYEKGEVLFK